MALNSVVAVMIGFVGLASQVTNRQPSAERKRFLLTQVSFVPASPYIRDVRDFAARLSGQAASLARLAKVA